MFNGLTCIDIHNIPANWIKNEWNINKKKKNWNFGAKQMQKKVNHFNNLFQFT